MKKHGDRRMFEDPRLALRPPEKRIHGHLVTVDRVIMATVDSDIRNERTFVDPADPHLVRARVDKALPPWIKLGWTPPAGGISELYEDRNTLWMDLIFGTVKPPEIPPGCTIYSERGALVFETTVSRTPPGPESFFRLVTPFLAAKKDLLALLVEEAKSSAAIRRRIVALKVLIDQLPDHELTKEAIAAAVAHENVELRAIALAASEWSSSRSGLLAIAADKYAPSAALVIAIRKMIEHGEDTALIEVPQQPVPSEVAREYLERFRRSSDPRAEKIVIAYLRSAHRDEAASVLTRIGGRDALIALNEVIGARGLKRGDGSAIDVAIELISERLKSSGVSAGALSVTGEGSGEGRLSVAAGEEGALSFDRERKD